MSAPPISVTDGERYVLVVDRVRGMVYRVRKPRIGLMRFGAPPVYGPLSPKGEA